MKQKPFTKLQSRAPTLNSQQRILFTMFTRPDWSSSGQPTSSTNAIIPYSAGDQCPVPGDWWPFKPSPEQQITWEPRHWTIPAPARWQSTVLANCNINPWWFVVGGGWGLWVL